MEHTEDLSPTVSPADRYRALLPQRLETAAIKRLLPRARAIGRMNLLDIGLPNPAASAELRACGGTWSTIARSPAHAAEAASFLKTDVACLGCGGEIPYADRVFDVVVVALDIFTAMPDTMAFIKECNRVLRPTGLLILSVQAKRSLSILDSIRARHTKDPANPYAPKFTEESLFDTLKNGFDVLEVESYCKFFVEWARLRERKLAEDGLSEGQIAQQLGTRFAVSNVADKILSFAAKGHVIIVSARRRQWSNRVGPLMVDGHSISDTVLFHPPA